MKLKLLYIILLCELTCKYLKFINTQSLHIQDNDNENYPNIQPKCTKGYVYEDIKNSKVISTIKFTTEKKALEDLEFDDNTSDSAIRSIHIHPPQHSNNMKEDFSDDTFYEQYAKYHNETFYKEMSTWQHNILHNTNAELVSQGIDSSITLVITLPTEEKLNTALEKIESSQNISSNINDTNFTKLQIPLDIVPCLLVIHHKSSDTGTNHLIHFFVRMFKVQSQDYKQNQNILQFNTKNEIDNRLNEYKEIRLMSQIFETQHIKIKTEKGEKDASKMKYSEYKIPKPKDGKDYNKYKFGCMIDAGSTGSRIFIYRWKPRIKKISIDPYKNTPGPQRPFTRPNYENHWSISITPGIHTTANKPHLAGSMLLPLLEFAYLTFDSLKQSNRLYEFPIYFKATGGMRELPISSQTDIQLSVRKTLQSSKFYFQSSFVTIISGEQEGVFGWLSVNYLLSNKTLFWNDLYDTSINTVGALDLGGASWQVTFHINPDEILLAHRYPLAIGHTRNSLYTECFWYYGRNSALWRVHSLLFFSTYPGLITHNYNDIKNDPYMNFFSKIDTINLIGDDNSNNDTIEKLQNEPLNDEWFTKHSNHSIEINKHLIKYLNKLYNNTKFWEPNKNTRKFISPCLPTGLEIPYTSYKGIPTIIIGKSNWDWCYLLTLQIITTRLVGPCSNLATIESPIPGQCTSFIGQYNPDYNRGLYYAFSAFSTFPEFFNLSNTASLRTIRSKGIEFCSIPWDKIIKKYPNINKLKLQILCWLSVYQVAILSQGLHFSYDKAPIIWSSTINGEHISYALGSMLFESNELPWEISPDKNQATILHKFFLYRKFTFILLLTTLFSFFIALYYYYKWLSITVSSDGSSCNDKDTTPVLQHQKLVYYST